MPTEPGNLLGQPWMLFVKGGGKAAQGDPNRRWDMPRAVEGAESLEALNVPPDRVLGRFAPPVEALEILARLFEVDGRLMPLPTMLFLTENRAAKRDLLISGVWETLRQAGAPEPDGSQRPLILVVGSDSALRGEVARLLQESDFDARVIVDAKADLPERQADLIVIVA